MSILDQLTKSLVDVYAKKLSDQEKAELIQALEVLADDQKYNLFKNTFPDSGDLSINRYPKHKAFFEAGASYRERAMICGNRCLTPWSYIETDRGPVPILKVMTETPAAVFSWDGTEKCIARTSQGILKGIEKAYRIVTDTGEFFDCTRKHRVLTTAGWLSLDRLMSLSDGLRLTGKREDYQASCVADGYLCDQQLLQEEDTCQDASPSQVDAQKCAHLLFELEDAKAHISRYIHASQLPVHLSTLDDLQPLSGLFELFSAARIGKPFLPLIWSRREVQRLVAVLDTYLRSGGEELPDLSSTDAILSFLRRGNFHGAADKLVSLSERGIIGNRSLSSHGRGCTVPESLDGDTHTAIFFPCTHPPLVGGRHIVAVVPLYYQPIVDVTVEKTECYFSAGIVSHNTGKTVAAVFEVTCHATGLYPRWWKGRRYTRPVKIWMGGDTATTCRDIIQNKLLGNIGDFGSGMIPRDTISEWRPRRNVPDAVEIIRVKHVSGGLSEITLKTYDQGRDTWQGTEVDAVFLDEEAPMDVYGEALIRTMTTGGFTVLTFTPLQGLTDLVQNFLDNSQESDSKYPKYVQQIGWKDVPHLKQDDIDQMMESTPPQLREARSQGIPTVGSGLIYPLDLKLVTVDDFKLPKHFAKAFGMDVGWNATAAVFGAVDRDNDVIYVYSEHKQGEAEPVIHATSIKARGEWLKGVIDPASRGRSQVDGQNLYMLYRKEGLKIYPADNAVEAGIYEVWQRLSTGRLKIFASCSQLLRELSLYHRDENGKVVKKNDHLLDALRYLLQAPANVWGYPVEATQQRKVLQMNSSMKACI